jgi:hypothetical protein
LKSLLQQREMEMQQLGKIIQPLAETAKAEEM